MESTTIFAGEWGAFVVGFVVGAAFMNGVVLIVFIKLWPKDEKSSEPQSSKK